MRRRAFLILLSGLAVSLFVWVKVKEPGREGALARLGVAATHSSPNSTERVQFSVLNQKPRTAPQVLQSAEAFGATRAFLAWARKCARLIENEKGAFATKSHGYTLLEGLERKLFMDDYAYAALCTGILNREDAAIEYQNLKEETSAEGASGFGKDDDPPVRERPKPNSRASEMLGAQYQRWISGVNPGYSNILQTVTELVPGRNLLESDAFKDLAVYVALRTEADGWIAGQREDAARSIENASKWIGNQAYLNNTKASIEQMHQQEIAELEMVKQAYEDIFKWRLDTEYVTDSAVVFNALNRLVLTNSGPELGIP